MGVGGGGWGGSGVGEGVWRMEVSFVRGVFSINK